MVVTIDRAGRLVIPKRIRELAGLRPDLPLEITVRDGRVEIVPAPRQVTIVRRGRVSVAVPQQGEAGPLTEETVRDTRRRLRERDR